MENGIKFNKNKFKIRKHHQVVISCKIKLSRIHLKIVQLKITFVQFQIHKKKLVSSAKEITGQ